MLVKPNRVGCATHPLGGPPAAGGGLMPIKRNRVGCATRAPGSPPADGGGSTPIKPNEGGSATKGKKLVAGSHSPNILDPPDSETDGLADSPLERVGFDGTGSLLTLRWREMDSNL